MTSSQPVVNILSANESFKLKYARTLRWSVLAALLLTALGVWLMPRYEPTPYTLRQEILEIIEVDIIKDIDLRPEQPLERPVIHREIEPVADPNLPGDDVPPNSRWLPQPPAPPVMKYEKPFVASSTKPILTFWAKPHYPEMARMSGIEGTVIVKVLVGANGLIKAAEVIQSVHPLLDRAAMEAAMRCRFEPGRQRTIPVKAAMAIPYRFRVR